MARIAGAHIKGRLIHIGVVKQADAPELFGIFTGHSARIEPSDSLPEASRLANFKERISAEISAATISRVVLVETRQHASWTYKNAYNRVTAAAALMLAAHDLSLDFSTVKTTEIAKILDMKATELDSIESSRFGLDQNPTYWTTGLGQACTGAAFALATEASEKQ